MSTIDDLKAKALAIAENYPGPWAWDAKGWLCGPYGGDDHGLVIVDASDYSSGPVADYLAAVDPGTILALIEAAESGGGANLEDPQSTSVILERAIVAAVEAQDASSALALAQAMDILDDIEARRDRRPS